MKSDKKLITIRELNQSAVNRLRELWDAGVASGDVQPVDMKALRANARRRLEAQRKTCSGAADPARMSWAQKELIKPDFEPQE